MRRFSKFASLFLLFVASAGCATPDVGAPCLPEQVPDDGFSSNEAYIETSSVQCETRVCMVYRLNGDPTEGCVPQTCANPDDTTCQERTCPSQQDIDERIYCTCRCKAPSAAFAECECPAGYTCQEVLRQGGPGVAGSYCVNSRTVND